jgi:hypothetical protein
MSDSFSSKSYYTGTGTVSSSGTAVTGINTLFTTELVVGNPIIINGQVMQVTVITDATHLTMNGSLSSNASGATYQYDKNSSFVNESSDSTNTYQTKN